jgi:hypothetical protein
MVAILFIALGVALGGACAWLSHLQLEPRRAACEAREKAILARRIAQRRDLADLGFSAAEVERLTDYR